MGIRHDRRRGRGRATGTSGNDHSNEDEGELMSRLVFHSGILPALMLALACAPRPQPEPVRPGIDVLLSDSLHLVDHRRVALLTNQTGIDRTGIPDVERLLAAGVELTAIFSPEHGYRGVLDQENIGHGVDSATGLRIWSLFGNVRAPTAEMLERVDALVIDLQDIGARPYTFASTMLLAMRSAEAEGCAVIVLDRPNPIGGTLVQGPMLDTAFTSFVGMLPLPMRHGLTLGEIARLGAQLLGIDVELTVIPVAGWHRTEWFDDTGLPWVPPSPSMPSLTSATHYPGTVIFEATNLSVGRGTPVPFQVVGAPWLDVAAIVAAVGPVPGVRLSDTTIVPRDPPDRKYPDRTLPAVLLTTTDRSIYDPVRVAVSLLAAIQRRHPDSLVVRRRALAQRLGSDAAWDGILNGRTVDQITAQWGAVAASFRARWDSVRLYP
jgi:uncharacterized protein YbbC (DUF1343 family)